MDVAKEVLQGILEKLAPEDSVSIVLFSDAACTPKALGPLRCANLADIKRQARRSFNCDCQQRQRLLRDPTCAARKCRREGN